MAKIYRKRGNKLNEVVTFDSACTRQENQPLVYDATDGSVHTTTHIGCLNADDVSVGNLTVTGQAIIQEQVTDTIDSNTLVLRSNADAGLTGTENSGVIIHNYNGSEDLYAVTDNTGTFRVGTAVSTTTTYAYLRYNKADNKWYSTEPGVTPTVEVTPVGSPTSWDSVVTSGDEVEYTNIVFSVIDRTSLQPLTTRDESTNMEKDYLTKWNSTNEKVVTTGTSCTHDLCANGDVTSTGDITAEGNVCVKTNITVDGNSCVKGDSTVSGEIHSCKCITAPTACVSDDLYVAGDINNCNTDSIFHGSYGCFEKNVCIKGDLAIDGTIAVSSLTSDHVISVENTTNSIFYPSFVQNNHLVAGSNDLYTNGDLQYNPSTDVLCTKTFCSDRGIVQSAISGVTAANLGLTAGTVYSLSTIVSCLQACCGNKAVSYSFSYTDAANPKVAEYGHSYAYLLTFEKLDNNDLSGTWSKTRWLVTGENGVSWTVTGNTTSTAGSATWTVNEHVVDQVCVATAGNNQYFPLIFSTCQSTPSCSKKTLYTDSANQLMYNPNTNTLKTDCVCANISLSLGNLSYKYCFIKDHNSDRTTLLVLKDISCAVCCSYCAIGIVGRVCDSRVPTECASTSITEDVNFYIKANYGATGSSAMDIKYYGYGEDQLRPVIITRNDNKVYAAMCISGSKRFLSFDTIGACSVIDEVCLDANGVYKDSSGHTYAITKAGDLATLCVNASSANVWTADQNTNYPIVFSTCQKTPTIGCKTLYNDSANNLMYNPGTNTMSVPNVNASGTVCATNGFTSASNGFMIRPECSNEVNLYSPSGNCTKVYVNHRGGVDTIWVGKGDGTNGLGTVCAATFCGNLCGSFCGCKWLDTGFYSSADRNLVITDGTVDGMNDHGVSAACSLTFNPATGDMKNSGHLCAGYMYSISPSYSWDTYKYIKISKLKNPSVILARSYNSTYQIAIDKVPSVTTNGDYGIKGFAPDTGNSIWLKTMGYIPIEFFSSAPLSFEEQTTAPSGVTFIEPTRIGAKVATTATTTNANYYLTFVDSNNETADSENVYTNARLYYNPNTNIMSVPNVNASGTVCATSLKVCDMTVASSSDTPISLTCGSYNLTVDSKNSIAIGTDVNASGSRSVGIGHLSRADQTSVAIGACSNALTGSSVAIGICSCSQTYAVAIGCDAKATYYSVSIGCAAVSCNSSGIAIGHGAKNCVQSGIAIGNNANTSAYSSACVLVDERAGSRMRRSIICWNNGTKQCDLFCAIYCRFNFNYYDDSSTVYVSVTGVYGCDTLNEIKWDKNETPKNFDLGRQGFTNAITVYDGCTSAIPKAGYVQIVGYAR